MSDSYRYAYLFGSLLFIPVWGWLFWRTPQARREMISMSALFAVSIGVPLEWLLYSRDWWHPITVTGTAIGVEDVIYSIGNGGYMAALYAAVFRVAPRPGPGRPGWPLRLAPIAAMAGLPAVLCYGLGWHSF